MLFPLLLALGGVPAAALTPPPGEYVREVRIETDEPERLARFVGLVPGRPLDPEAVRHTVELMYATGEFEDILVEVERPPSGEGIDVVFRPRPAPLFADVRVEGDRVMSAGALRRAARLRSGEPLWPARLERAGRDAALELVRRGHLEALVRVEAVRVPGGADAVFHVRAGPRVHVSSASVTGVQGLDLPPLDDLVRPRPGETYRPDEAEKAKEQMRRRLARSGRWRASVTLLPRYSPGPARMALVFHVVAGPPMDVEVRGASVPGGRLDEVRDLLRDGAVGRDALEAGAERLESYLRRQGHREARVRSRVESSVSGEIVVYEAEPGPRATVASVEIRGAKDELLEGLATRVGEPVRDADLAADARTLTRRLEEQGHFEAEVEPDVPEGGGPLPVAFLAHPGPQATVGAVTVDGPPLPLSGRPGPPQDLALRPSLPYRARDLATSRETLLSAWRRVGYLDARVDPEPTFSADRTEVDVRFVVDPGPRTIVEDVVLAGLRQTRETTVTRDLSLRRGEPFSFERVLESQRRLLGLGIFERVGISELDPQRERRRDVVVRVQEAPRTSVSWGVGYSEQDRLRGSVELTRRNLSGLGRTASVFARGSVRGSRFLLNLREPWLFGRRLDSFVNAFWEEEDRTSFDYKRRGGLLQVGRRVDERTALLFRYLYQGTSVFNIEIPLEEIDRQFRTYTVSGPAASVVWDSRDDPLEPRRGSFLGADLQLSLDSLGGASFLKGFFQATSVRPLRPDLLFVVSGRVGLASTFGDSPALLPLPERYFAGGDYGPRGFPVDEVGPKFVRSDGEVFPTGGNALLLGGAELRYNLTRSFQLATFLDLGNVYPTVSDVSLADLRSSTGLGLRYMTPIGPVRLRLGVRARPPARREALAVPPDHRPCLLAWSSSCSSPFPPPGRTRRPLASRSRRAHPRRGGRPPAPPLGGAGPRGDEGPRPRGGHRGGDRRAADGGGGGTAAPGGGHGGGDGPGPREAPRGEPRCREPRLPGGAAAARPPPGHDLQVRGVPLPSPGEDHRGAAAGGVGGSSCGGPGRRVRGSRAGAARAPRAAGDRRAHRGVGEGPQVAGRSALRRGPGLSASAIRSPGRAVERGGRPRIVGAGEGEEADAQEVGESRPTPSEAHPGGDVVAPHHRNLGDTQAPPPDHVEDLDVEGESVETAPTEGDPRGGGGEELEAALRVVEPGQEQDLDQAIEDASRRLPVGGLADLDARSRHRSRADGDGAAAVESAISRGSSSIGVDRSASVIRRRAPVAASIPLRTA